MIPHIVSTRCWIWRKRNLFWMIARAIVLAQNLRTISTTVIGGIPPYGFFSVINRGLQTYFPKNALQPQRVTRWHTSCGKRRNFFTEAGTWHPNTFRNCSGWKKLHPGKERRTLLNEGIAVITRWSMTEKFFTCWRATLCSYEDGYFSIRASQVLKKFIGLSEEVEV